MFLLHSGKSRSWAERSNSSSRFLFFWCMITKPKNSFGNCVLQGQHWKGCFERWLSQGVVLDIWVFWNNLIFFDVIAKIQGAGWCLQVEVCFLSIGIELHVSPWFILNCCTSKEKKSLEAKHYNLTKDCVFARFVFFQKKHCMCLQDHEISKNLNEDLIKVFLCTFYVWLSDSIILICCRKIHPWRTKCRRCLSFWVCVLFWYSSIYTYNEIQLFFCSLGGHGGSLQVTAGFFFFVFVAFSVDFILYPAV